MQKLTGIFAAMCAPMDEHGKTVDMGRYRTHIDDMIDAAG